MKQQKIKSLANIAREAATENVEGCYDFAAAAKAVEREVLKRQGSGWIETVKRKPTKADGDREGWVLVGKAGLVTTCYWQEVIERQCVIPYWMPAPRAPKPLQNVYA